MKLLESETMLIGNLILKNGAVAADETTLRIRWLISHYLEFKSSDYSGWERLYVDPNDGRYWEVIYPQSEMQGGGPPALILISKEDALKKYMVEI